MPRGAGEREDTGEESGWGSTRDGQKDSRTAAQPLGAPRGWDLGAAAERKEEMGLTSEASCARRLRPQSSGQEDKVSLKRQTICEC